MAAAMMMTACGDSPVPEYNEEYTAIRFAGVTPDPDYDYNSDNITRYNFSFVDHPEDETFAYQIPVYLTGKYLTKDTRIGYEVDAENTTAPANSYQIESAVVPAGERNGYITVKLVKTEELQGDVTYSLALRLLPSAELKLSDKRYLNCRLEWTNNLPLPTHNNHLRSYNMLIAGMANFASTSNACLSTNGLLAIVAALGWNDWDDPVAHPGQYNNATTYYSYKFLPRYSYIYVNNIYMVYSRMVGEWLEKYEAEHGAPLLHNGGKLDGKPVQARYN